MKKIILGALLFSGVVALAQTQDQLATDLVQKIVQACSGIVGTSTPPPPPPVVTPPPVLNFAPVPANLPKQRVFVAEPVPTSSQHVLTVGTGLQYTTLAAAAAAYAPGDIIKIMTSLDNDSAAFTSNVQIWCKPGVILTWSAGNSKRMAYGKGFFVLTGTATNIEIDNCEAAGATVVDGSNGAAMRGDPGVSSVLKSVSFHDNQDGILANNGGTTTISIDNSWLYNNGIGGSGFTHNVYVGGKSITATNSYFGPVFTGNLFKSRAMNTTIVNSIVDSQGLDAGSYEIDIPNCGNVLVNGVVIVKDAAAAQHFMLSYGSEGCTADGRVNKYEMKNAILIGDQSTHFMLASGGASLANVNLHDSTLVGPIDTLPTMVNVKLFQSRADAGIGAPPALPPIPVAR